MKHLTILSAVLLTSSAFAQIAAKDESGVITFTNTSPQAVIAFVAKVYQPDGTASLYTHDFYFGSKTMAPGDIIHWDVVTDRNFPIPKYTPKVIFAQYEDGSVERDRDAPAIAQFHGVRADAEASLSNVLDAYKQGDAAFLDALKMEPTSYTAKNLLFHLRWTYDRMGIEAAIEEATQRLEIAKARDASGKF